jgi:histidine triad (HIT) family protein
MIMDVFCKIIKGELKADVVYKDEDFWVIKDINPQAPVHLLIIPAEHFLKIEDFTNGAELLGKAFILADKMAHKQGLGEKGYRLIVNEGEHGGKLVPHFHIHLLGGKRLGPKIIK